MPIGTAHPRLAVLPVWAAHPKLVVCQSEQPIQDRLSASRGSPSKTGCLPVGAAHPRLAVCQSRQPIQDSTFCSRFIESARMLACVICASCWEVSHCIACVTTSTSMVGLEVVTLWAPLSSCTVHPPCLTVTPSTLHHPPPPPMPLPPSPPTPFPSRPVPCDRQYHSELCTGGSETRNKSRRGGSSLTMEVDTVTQTGQKETDLLCYHV